ncbi:MAG: DUF481 domain-containing protein, partial [Gemmatimonadota bacterium]
RHQKRLRSLLPLIIALAALAATGSPLLAQKTDTLVVRNGDVMTGELKGLHRGKVEYSTDAAGTIWVKWTRVGTVETDKRFDIDLTDGSNYFGALGLGDEPNEVRIILERDTIVVATQAIVRMERLKDTFWRRLDGSIDLGMSFTQQNAKTDLNLDAEVKYKMDRNNFRFTTSTSFSRQDSVDNISRLNTTFQYLREFGERWYYSGVVVGEQNSQLNLEIRGTFGGLAGLFFVQSNKVNLSSGLGLAYARERFTDQEGNNALQGLLVTDFEFFSWGGLDTDLSSRLAVVPVLNQAGRWRIGFNASLSREIVSDFYLSVGLHEQFDSKPPTEDTEKNDFSVTTSFGWSF